MLRDNSNYESYLYKKKIIENNFMTLLDKDYNFRDITVKRILFRMKIILDNGDVYFLFKKDEIEEMFKDMGIEMKNYMIKKYLNILNLYDMELLVDSYSDWYIEYLKDNFNCEIWEM